MFSAPGARTVFLPNGLASIPAASLAMLLSGEAPRRAPAEPPEPPREERATVPSPLPRR